MNSKVFVLFVLSLTLQGCFVVSGGGITKTAEQLERPADILEYYSYPTPYKKIKEELIHEREDFNVRQITLETSAGESTVEFYQQRKKTDELVLVFPVLGGRPILSRYFANYFVERGIDTAIVHRSNEFKKPEKFLSLEKLLRAGVIRDRNAIDYFEQEEGKKVFGSFGMSRGAINVVITAGVDKRLEHNIIALGGTNLPHLFLRSKERRIHRYVNTIMDEHNFSREELTKFFDDLLITRPTNYSHYIDPEKTMMFLALCDRAVPYQFGRKLRQEIGKPKTIYMLSGHKTSVLYTQVAKVFIPYAETCGLPPAYIESESLLFYEKAFGRDLPYPYHVLPWKILQQPLNLLGYLIHLIPD